MSLLSSCSGFIVVRWGYGGDHTKVGSVMPAELDQTRPDQADETESCHIARVYRIIPHSCFTTVAHSDGSSNGTV
jgi:hypothetical protein